MHPGLHVSLLVVIEMSRAAAHVRARSSGLSPKVKCSFIAVCQLVVESGTNFVERGATSPEAERARDQTHSLVIGETGREITTVKGGVRASDEDSNLDCK